MILIAMYLLLSTAYFWGERRYALESVPVSAVALAGGYIAIYLLTGPTPHLGARAESMLAVVPILSLGAVLFPELNVRHPVVVTRTFGFAGLIFMFVLVCVFRVWVW